MATFINTGGGEIPNLRLLALTRAGGRGTMSNDPRLNRPALLTEPVPQTEEQRRLAVLFAANKRYDAQDRGNAKNSRIAPPSRNETSSTTSETLTDTFR